VVNVAAYGALGVLLVVVARGFNARVELAVAVAAAAVVLAFGAISPNGALAVLDALAPTLGFLAAIFVVAEVARRAGLFGAAGHLIGSRPRTARDVIVVVALVAAAITVTLSLDATAVLFTPVVIGVVGRRRSVGGPALLTTVEMANASSLALPVSNLTNLLVFPATGLTFAGFGLRMALPTVLVVAAVTWAGHEALTVRQKTNLGCSRCANALTASPWALPSGSP
jgi:arsenical pump membrane protein